MAVIIQPLVSHYSALTADASALKASISALKNSISTLESSIDILDRSSGRWETVAWSCAIAVGIGIVGEILVIAGEHRDDLMAWRRGIMRPPDHPDVRRFWFDIIATVLVLIGVFGEAGASMKLASINSQLRSKTSELRAKSEQLLALVTQEAGSAAASAGQAQRSAERAKKSADNTQKTVDEVGKKAEIINWKVDAAQYFLSERVIRDPDDLKKKLAPFKGKTIFFRSYVNDGEGYFLCKELSFLASDIGITAIDQCAQFPVERPYPNTGINVFAPDVKSMEVLNAALAGATLYGSSGSLTGWNGTVIFVGRKRSAHVGETAQTRAAAKDAAAMKKAQQKKGTDK